MSSENLTQNPSECIPESEKIEVAVEVEPYDPPRWGVIVPIMIVAVLLFCALIVGGLIYFASGSDWVSASEQQCHGNLRRIGRALASYHADYGCFPPAYLADETGKPMHSWRVLILPYLGEHELYEQYRFDQPWNGPDNQALVDQRPDVYCCPDHIHSRNSNIANYMMIVGEGTISDGPGSTSLSDIQDNPATTLLVTETAKTGVRWLEPTDLVLDPADPYGDNIDSYHRNGNSNVLFCDGSVEAVSFWGFGGGFGNTSEDIATIAGSEPISLP